MPGAPVVLASASPRRIELLDALLGRESFTVQPADLDEAAVAVGIENAAAMVTALARAKAEAVWHAGTIVIGADTVVRHREVTLGKPTDRAAAAANLRSMRGNQVEVISAVTVVGPRGARADEVVRSRLLVGHPSDDAIADYVASGAADDKAGGLAVQGAAGSFVDEVRGCMTNVYGLPVCATMRLLGQAGHSVVGDCPDCGDSVPH